MGEGHPGLQEPQPRSSSNRRFAVRRPLLRLRTGFHEMSMNGEAPVLGDGEALGQEAVRAGVERGGRDHAHDMGRALGDEVQRPLHAGDLRGAGLGRLPRRDGAPAAVGGRRRDGRAHAEPLGGIDAGPDLGEVDGAPSGEVVQDARGPVLEGFQQGDVVGGEQVVVIGIEDVLGSAPFEVPQLEGQRVPEASLQDLGVVRVRVDEARDDDLVTRVHYVASLRRERVRQRLDGIDPVSRYPHQPVPEHGLGCRAQQGPREYELLVVHEVGSQ